MRRGLWVGWVLVVALTGCSGKSDLLKPVKNQTVETDSLKGLQTIKMFDEPTFGPATARLREQSLKDTGMSIGARAGLAARSKEINAEISEREQVLTKIFNFQGLLLPDNILPPVMVLEENTLNVSDGHTLRLADKTYRLLSQARFVTAPPHWRDYLQMSFEEPEPPHRSLLPQNEAEKQIWVEATAEGWAEGVKQADSIYSQNMARLKRDYKGMILYRRLLALNMVSAPYVAQRELGVTGGGDSMSINDRLMTITAVPALKTDTHEWKPQVVR